MPLAATPQVCRAGSVSLDPLASGGCNRCDEGSHATCTGSALLPHSGWWHSHPRSPVVHRCLAAAACQHQAAAAGMQEWARAHAEEQVEGMEGVYQEYVGMQCAQGYQVRWALMSGRSSLGRADGPDSIQTLVVGLWSDGCHRAHVALLRACLPCWVAANAQELLC